MQLGPLKLRLQPGDGLPVRRRPRPDPSREAISICSRRRRFLLDNGLIEFDHRRPGEHSHQRALAVSGRERRTLRPRHERIAALPRAVADVLALAVSALWLVVAFASARSDFQQGLGHGSTPAETLAQAGIAAQQARADEVLNLISRSGSTSFQQDFTAMHARIGGSKISRSRAG